ncbi:MAG: hypothetical protein QXD62_02100 [Candidatus Woesearchaeota archaeon]
MKYFFKIFAIFLLISLLSCSSNKLLVTEEIGKGTKVIALSDNSLKIIIPENAFNKTKLEIFEVKSPPKTKIGNPIMSFEIKSTESPQVPVTLEFQIPNHLLNSNESLEEQFAVMYYDENEKVYVEVPADFDEENKIIKVTTDHFSIWSLFGFDKYTKAVSPHFIIRFKSTDSFAGLGARETFEFVAKVRELLEDYYEKYVSLGFKPIKKRISVYIISQDDSLYNPFTGNIIISGRSPNDYYTKHEIAHELFHLFQNQDINLFRMHFFRWFLEASAVYAADILALGQNKIDVDLNNGYIFHSLTMVNGSHEYRAAHFIDFLVKKGAKFKDLWNYVTKWYMISPESGIDSYLRDSLGIRLVDMYQSFVMTILFSNSTYLNIPLSLYSAKMYSKEIQVDPSKKDPIILSFNLTPYSTYLLAITPKGISKDNDILLKIQPMFPYKSKNKNELNGLLYLAKDDNRLKAEYVGVLEHGVLLTTRVSSLNDKLYVVIVSGKYSEIGTLNISASVLKKESHEFSHKEKLDFLGKEFTFGIEGKISGEDLKVSEQRVENYYTGKSFNIFGVVKAAPKIPIEITLKSTHDFTEGNVYRFDTSDGYRTLKINKVYYVLNSVQIDPKTCKLKFPREEKTLNKLDIKIEIPSNNCTFSDQISLSTKLIINYTETHYELRSVSKTEVREILRGKKEDLFAIPLADIHISSSS